MNPNAIMAGIQMFGAFADASYQNEMIGIQNSLASAQAQADANNLLTANAVAAAQAAYTTQARSISNRRIGAQLSEEALAAATTAARADAAMQASNFEASIAASEQMGQAAALGATGSVTSSIALATSLRNARQQQYLANQRADTASSNSAVMARLAMQITHSQDLGFTTVGQQFQRPVANKVAQVSPLYATMRAGAGSMLQAVVNMKQKEQRPLGLGLQTNPTYDGGSPYSVQSITGSAWGSKLHGGYL